MSKIEEVLKLKKLLDKGLITQEDFEILKAKIFEDPKSVSVEIEKIKNDDFKASIESKRNDLAPDKTKKCPQCGSINSLDSLKCVICKTDLQFFETKNENTTNVNENSVNHNADDNKFKYLWIVALVFGVLIAILFYRSFYSKQQDQEAPAVDSTVVVPIKVDSIQEDTIYSNLNSVDTTAVSNAVNLEIGMDYEGGKIAYIFEPNDGGYIEGEVHGIVMANDDLFSIWGCSNQSIESTYSSIGTGGENTKNIVDNCNSKSAAQTCLSLVSGGYDDWFLPSKDELTKVYSNIDQLGGYPSGSYGVWSSTEYDESTSYVMSFDGNGNWVTLPKSYGFHIKAIRYF